MASFEDAAHSVLQLIPQRQMMTGLGCSSAMFHMWPSSLCLTLLQSGLSINGLHEAQPEMRQRSSTIPFGTAGTLEVRHVFAISIQ